MDSDTDLPHQPDTQQQPRPFKTIIWKAIFIPLGVVNVGFFFFAGRAMNQSAGAVSGFVLVPFFFFPLTIIDFLAVFFYIRKQHPHGIARVISYTVLALIILHLVQIVLTIILIALPMSFTNF